MKSRERMPLVVGMLGILLILSTFVSTDTIVDLTGASSSDLRKVTVVSVTHDPIVIISDANFSATAGNEGWIGNGSAGNPYVIDGLDIDQGGAADNCISISNTRVNFTIQNCILTGASNPSSGIYLDNVMYGKIMNNTFFNNYFNIYIWNSHYLLVKNNTGTDSLYSISLRQGSSHNIITGNNVSYNTNRGINLESSSHDNLVINNTCNNNVFGIVLYQVTANSVDNNTFSNNVNDGIHINNANFNNFTKNLCRNNSRGVNLFGMSNNIKIENNTFSDNTNDGIYAEDAGSNYFTNNLFSNNGHGIFLYGNCDSYTITNNTCTGNSEGIRLVGYLGSGFPPVPNVPDNIDILWNIFTDNAANVIVSLLGINILFDYNFWSDYAGDDTDGNGVGDSPYTFTGNQDSHPLMAPPGSPVIWLQPPTDQILLIQVSFIYDLNASVYGGLDYWWINDTTNFAINQLGVVSNNTFLAADDYGLSVYVNDTHGNVLSGAFIVTISDVEAPIWIDLPTSRVLEIGLSLFYKMNASDISGLDHWWVNDTANFAIDSEGNIVNNTFLAVNGYGLHVWVNDTLGNTLDTTFMVSIIDTTNPTWITGPQDQELEEGYPYVFHLYVYDLSNIHKWWVNDTTHFTIDDYGMISNITSLAEGVYACEVKVNDTSGNILSGNFTLTIHEASPPNWDTIPINQIVEFGNGLYYDLDVTDFSDIDQWWINDTTSFNIDQDGTITNSTPLAVGTYSILISVSDIVGYIQSHEITITVEDTTPPNWIETPIDQ
ncbi:MAG: nitrous oxide reductase family maturation protein NosD, partial [Candidatus Thorarchaeota archaeon]